MYRSDSANLSRRFAFPCGLRPTCTFTIASLLTHNISFSKISIGVPATACSFGKPDVRNRNLPESGLPGVDAAILSGLWSGPSVGRRAVGHGGGAGGRGSQSAVGDADLAGRRPEPPGSVRPETECACGIPRALC